MLLEQDPPKPSSSPARVKAAGQEWADLDVICLKALKYDASQRYGSVLELIHDIDRFVARKPISARPDSLPYRIGKFWRRNQRAVIASGIGLIAATALVAFFTIRLARERSRTLRETAIATAMNRFLSEDLLAQSDPFQSGKAKELFADVVERSSPAIDAQFKPEPLVAARLHATLARAFGKRSDFTLARHEYGRAIDLFERAEGKQSPDAATLRLQEAVMEGERFQPDSLANAQALVRDAKQSIAGLTRPNPELAIYLASAEGIVGFLQNDARRANSSYAEALRLARTTHVLDAEQVTELEVSTAFSYIHMSDGVHAEPLLREAIRAESERYGPVSPRVLRERAYLAQSLMVQRKYGDALKEADFVYPILVERLGEENHTSLTILGTRAVCESQLQLWDRAITDDLTAHRIAAAKLGPTSMFALALLSDAGLSQCRSGHSRDGEANARQAFEISRKSFGAESGLAGGTAYSLAFCLTDLGKLDEAFDLLTRINVQAAIAQSSDSAVSGDIALLRAEIVARRGDYASLKRYIADAETQFNHMDIDPFDRKSLGNLKNELDAHTSR